MRVKSLFTSLFFLLVFISFSGIVQAQKYELKDSVNVRKKDRMKQWSYEHNLTNFPPKKKNNWALGFKGGLGYVVGDVRPDPGWAVGINLRKALGHVFSLRLEGSGGISSGLNFRPNGGYLYNSGINGTNDPAINYFNAAHPFVFYNYRMQHFELGLHGIFNLNNLNFHNANPRWNLYAFIGGGAMMYRTTIDQADANGQIYDYSFIPDNADPSVRKDALSALRNLTDGDYETEAESNPYKGKIAKHSLNPIMDLGAGFSFKISRRVELVLEHKISWAFDDLLDGQRWEETNTLTSTQDLLMQTTLGFNFRIGKGEDALWWGNALNAPLNKIRNNSLAIDKGNKDSDNDGVVDALDKEPHTPEGVAVDVKGISLDSDADGIPDFRDAEPFSAKGAQVDNAGRSLDSDNDGVADIADQEINSAPGAQVDAKGVTIKGLSSTMASGQNASLDAMLPLIQFELNSSEVKQTYYPQLFKVAKLMEEYPEIKLTIVGHADNRSNDKNNIALSQKRAENVLAFMTNQMGIDKTRFMIEYKGAGEPLIKDLPSNHDKKFEKYHFLNRRVEFRVIGE